MNEILRRSFTERGCGLTVHSRAADLRARGYTISSLTAKGKARGERFLYQMEV